ncbi:unnamed protein product [Candida verbasci]|uniref:XPG N-terminal domain-containing protein n=1 Tax=Candida verbasci TaxID=1227364 RepID=A0A9W4TYL4_9ASCO|nr:unnamed protein product [Candida verbasci]
MPIKSLESYLFERKLANTSSIEILENTTIGIDVDHYLNRIYTFKKEQYLSAIGGLPSSLKDYLINDLAVFKESNIKPIFVLNGLNINLQNVSYKTNELSTNEQHIENTWNKIIDSQKNSFGSPHHQFIESFRLFNDSLSVKNLYNDVISLFISLGVEYFITPYDSSFQLSYLYQNDIIDTIYGSTDLLLTKIDKFILGMEFQSKEFRFINKFKVLKELNLNERQFLDLSIIVGCNLQPNTFPIFPPLPKPNNLQPYPQISYFKIGLDIIYQYNQFNNNNQNSDLVGYIMSLNDSKLLDLYYKGLCAFKFIPILNKEGVVELYNNEMAKLGFKENIDFIESSEDGEGESEKVVKVPSDLHEIINQRLPPEIYFYQSIGLLPIDLLESITKGQLDVRPPLELGSNNSKFKTLITSKYYLNLLDYQYNLITQFLARYYQVKKIKVKFWFKDDFIELNNRIMPSISKRINNLFISTKTPEFALTSFFNNIPETFNSLEELKSNNDVVSTAFLRTLYLYDIIDEKSKFSKSSIGKILTKFSKENPRIPTKQFEHLILILFLLQSKQFSLFDSTPEFTNVSSIYKQGGGEISPKESNYIKLISRIFSLFKFNISPINYQGPISRNLLNFRSNLEFINKNLINTLECVLVDLIVLQEQNQMKTTYKSKDEWYQLILNLPFYQSLNNTLMGVIGEIYFEVACKYKKQGKEEKKEIVDLTNEYLLHQIFQIHQTTYNIDVFGKNSVKEEILKSDFKNCLNWWDYFIKFAKVVHEEDKGLINDEIMNDINATNDFLKQLT